MTEAPASPVADPAPAPTYEFDAATTAEITALVMHDPDFMRQTDGLIEPAYFFDDTERTLIALALDHWRKYRETPSPAIWVELIKEALKAKHIRADQKPDVVAKLRETLSMKVRSRGWLLDKIAEFARQQAIIQAMTESASAIWKVSDPDRFDKVQKAMTRAFGVALNTGDEAYDYFAEAEIEARTAERLDIIAGGRPKTGITTGVKELDDALYHQGWGRRELSLILGGAKSSKSFTLGFFAGNAAKAGHNVLFVTLENSRKIVAARLDAQFSGIGLSEHLRSPNTIEIGVKSVAATSGMGRLYINEYPTGTFRPSQLRALLDRYKTNGVKFSAIFIDYADIMAPSRRTDDKIENSSSVYREIRAIAQEEEAAVVTATQMNRTGHASVVARAEFVADDFNRIRLADIVIAINRSEDERAEHKARLTFVACRNQPDGRTLFIRQNLDKGLAVESVESVE